MLREWRGDAHFIVLAANDLGPCDCTVLQTATGHFPEAIARTTRLWDDEEVARDMLFAGEEDGGGRKPRSKGRWAPQQWTGGRRRKVNKVRASVTGPQLATRFLGANVLGYTPI